MDPFINHGSACFSSTQGTRFQNLCLGSWETVLLEINAARSFRCSWNGFLGEGVGGDKCWGKKMADRERTLFKYRRFMWLVEDRIDTLWMERRGVVNLLYLSYQDRPPGDVSGKCHVSDGWDHELVKKTFSFLFYSSFFRYLNNAYLIDLFWHIRAFWHGTF